MATPTALPLADILRRTPLFATLTEFQLQRLVHEATKLRFRRDDLVLARGSACHNLFVLLSGRAMESSGPTGNGVVLFRYLKPGDYFGECSLIDGLPYSANVQCTAAADVLVIDGGRFAHVMGSSTAFSMAIIQALTERLRRANRHIGALALGNVSDRTVKALAEVSAEEDGQHWVINKVSPTDIANMVGASRESVSRAIRDLKRSGQLVNGSAGRMLLRRSAALV